MNEKEINVSIENLSLLSKEQAWYFRSIPISKMEPNIATIWTDHKNNASIVSELEIIIDSKINIEVKESELITELLHKYYPNKIDQTSPKKNININSNTTAFIGNLIIEAKNQKSSDIHIECYEEIARIRIRIDGMLIERYTLNKNEYPSLINKIKIMANMDIAEKRLPQDGRILFNQDTQKFDLRVSILPTLYGEKVVLRILNTNNIELNLNSLGFSDFELRNYLNGIKKPNGIVLISGPTGSGKTTTLYSTLNLLNKENRNILTIEDPIEYTIFGVNQVQLKESIGLSFSSALRTFLRQDPDVIMVGEIRDVETASMAIRAALTGHLVLSTIHTNSAWGTVSRLIDMGIQPFLLANTLNTSVAQRLVRVLCNKCKKKESFELKIDIDLDSQYSLPEYQYLPNGCEHCQFTGYKGRKAIYEVIYIDKGLSNCIKNNLFDISDELKSKGIKTLSNNAISLFINGETSFDEIYPHLLNN